MSIGRGLGALITPTGPRKKISYGGDNQSPDRIWSIPLSEIHPNPNQPRRNFAADELAELAQSIKEHGILQPILVAEKPDGGYEIIAGERRWRAAEPAGLSTIPAIVKEMAAQDQVEVSLIENIQRADLNPVEEAFAYRRLMEEYGLTQQQVGEKVGKSRPSIANAVRLLELPDEIQQMLIDGKISMGQGRALLSITDTKQQLDLARSMLGQKISVRELESAVRQRAPKSKLRRDPNLLYWEEQLRAALGTKVNIVKKGGAGSITLNFYSDDELDRLMKKLTS